MHEHTSAALDGRFTTSSLLSNCGHASSSTHQEGVESKKLARNHHVTRSGRDVERVIRRNRFQHRHAGRSSDRNIIGFEGGIRNDLTSISSCRHCSCGVDCTIHLQVAGLRKKRDVAQCPIGCNRQCGVNHHVATMQADLVTAQRDRSRQQALVCSKFDAIVPGNRCINRNIASGRVYEERC